MKFFFRVVLVGATLLQGCYSYTALDAGSWKQHVPPENESVRITLKDGSLLECDAFQRSAVNAPFWCVGRRLEGNADSSYAGKVELSDIRSIEIKQYSGWRTIGVGVLTGAAVGLLTAAVTRVGEHPIIPSSREIPGDVVFLLFPGMGAAAGLIVGTIVAIVP